MADGYETMMAAAELSGLPEAKSSIRHSLVSLTGLHWVDASEADFSCFTAETAVGRLSYGVDRTGQAYHQDQVGDHNHPDLVTARQAAEEAYASQMWQKAEALGFKIAPVQRSLAQELAQAKAAVAQVEAEKKAMITLLYTDEVFVGSHWEDYPHADKGIWPVLCAHVQSYGADAEEIPQDEYVALAELVERFGRDAIQAWVCNRRGRDKPVKGKLTGKGGEALQAARRDPRFKTCQDQPA